MEKLTYVFPAAAVAFLLLVFSEYVPLLARPLPAADRDCRRWHRRDTLVCLLLTAVYAVTAFTGLGDREGIESFCKFKSAGQYALISLPADTEIGSVQYFTGVHTGSCYLQFSRDGENFDSVSTMKQGYADVLKWKTATLNVLDYGPVNVLRIIADREIWLGELALYDGSGKLIDDAVLDYPEGCAPLFDEQEKIPANAGFRNSTYFDEIYHARTALEHLENITPYEISHPPLGKLIIGLGIRIFGITPFGWRFMGTLFGVLMLPAIYFFLKKMFGGTLIPGCCTAVMAADFMHFVQTRIATIDTYGVFFTILMYLFMWLYWQSDRSSRKSWLPPLAMSGICFGLGAASKWTGIYAGAGLAVLWLLDRVFRAVALCGVGEKKRWLRETAENVLWCLLFFVAVPACIYYLSYWRYGTAAGLGGWKMPFSRDYFDIVLENQKYMFSYHSGVTATHPYSSKWWQWILDLRPILYYLEYFTDGTRSSFGAWVNPMLCWGGLLAMFCMAYLTVARRDRTALFILIGYLAQLLPWLLIPRVLFEYHYFPCTVFLLLALGHVFRTLELAHPRPKWVIFSFTAAAVLLFIVFYPELTGRPISVPYGNKFLQWFPSWPF